MLMQKRPAALVDHVSVAPMDDCHHDRIEIEALLRQDVLVALRRFLIGDSAENALTDKLLQPFGKQMPSDTQRGLEALEAASTQKAFAQDKQRPSVADDPDRPGH